MIYKMKKILLSTFFSFIAASCLLAGNPIKIMPVGNSITAGEHYNFPALEERTGYRKALYEMLINAGYHVDFVGSQSHGMRPEDDKDWYDWNCEAYPGWKIPDIASKVEIALKAYQPDILLVHVGTNGNDWDNKPGQVKDMLDMINSYSVDHNHPMTVFLCLIINRFKSEDAAPTTKFNKDVANMAGARVGDKIKVILVDMENGAGLDYSDSLPDLNANPPYEGGDMLGVRYPGVAYDKYHPNDKGNTKMAVKFYEELVKELEVPVKITNNKVESIEGTQVLLAQLPWQQHGKLEVSKTGHTIEHEDGTPFLWIGDTGWGLFQQLTREEVDHYLDNRQKLGFTVIQSVAFWYPHGGGMEGGPHNAANAYGHRPFSGSEDAPNTADPLLVKGGGPDSPNDYWDHVDYVIEAVKKRNMYLALLPCWGRAYITPQMGGAQQEFTEEEAKAYGVFLGKRYQQEPHIIWVLGGDAKAQIKGYDKNINYQEWDKRSVFRAMAEGITQGVAGQQPAWNQAHPAWGEVFITYHPDGDAPDNSSKWFHEDAWLDANGVEVWREVGQVYPTMLGDYQLNNPVKPSLFLEGSYEFGSYRHECGWVTPVRVRRQVYHTFFAGGAGHTYGAGPVWAMRGSGGDYNCGYTWKQALDFPGAAQFAGVAKAFLLAHQWPEWIPDGGVIDGSVGEGESLKTAVTSTSGDMALVYFSNNSQTQIKNRLNKAAVAHWFDPRNGQEKQAGSFKQHEVRNMAPPDNWEDAILVLQARPRVIVTSDGEIDDECSMVRFLLYANEWDIEGIVTSSSQYHWHGHKWAGDEWAQPYLEAYAKVRPNLVKHDSRYPTAEYLQERTFLGNVETEGEMDKITSGSQHIVKVLLDESDNRPIWIQAWGGTNTIARALKTIEEEHPEKMAEVANKIRFFFIWEQDSTYQAYIRPHWGKYNIQTIISDQFIAFFYHWKKYLPQEQQEFLTGAWMKQHVLENHGPLCSLYKAHENGDKGFEEGDFRSEGDSPAFFHTIETGLRNMESPDWGGWGGRYVKVRENTWLDPVFEPGYQYPEGRWYGNSAWGRERLKAEIPNDQELTAYLKPLWRWTEALQNDFASRADWCVKSFAEANHPPVVKLAHAVDLKARPGATVELSARGTSDPDGDELDYRWWQYREAGTYEGTIEIRDAGKQDASFTAPAGAGKGETLHIICEVTDMGTPQLTRYQRVVVEIE
ncbi:MAG: DUF1593 domain-containing protein [Phaeodactylibacter sp.]|nr:DUF1593 domain-containing protein [Phaeodactylibacter sp.]